MISFDERGAFFSSYIYIIKNLDSISLLKMGSSKLSCLLEYIKRLGDSSGRT